VPARAGICAIQVCADMRTLMVTGLALVNIHTVLPIILRDYVTGIAGANIATVTEIVTYVCATAAIIVRTVMTVI